MIHFRVKTGVKMGDQNHKELQRTDLINRETTDGNH